MGRGPAWFLYQPFNLPPAFLPWQRSSSTPSSSSSSTSSFFTSSSSFFTSSSNKGDSSCDLQTIGCSAGVPSPFEGLPQSALLCGRSEPHLFPAPWNRTWPAHTGASWVVHFEVGCLSHFTLIFISDVNIHINMCFKHFLSQAGPWHLWYPMGGTRDSTWA